MRKVATSRIEDSFIAEVSVPGFCSNLNEGNSPAISSGGCPVRYSQWLPISFFPFFFQHSTPNVGRKAELPNGNDVHSRQIMHLNVYAGDLTGKNGRECVSLSCSKVDIFC